MMLPEVRTYNSWASYEARKYQHVAAAFTVPTTPKGNMKTWQFVCVVGLMKIVLTADENVAIRLRRGNYANSAHS